MLRPILLCVAAAGAVVAFSALSAGVATAKSDEPVACVKMARTWESAVDEAKALNLPIVVHNHGFYCPPCWGMHASVMCNEDYIKFASDNTVEVIALQDLQKGIDAGGKQAGEYEAKDEKGNKVKYMLEFPGLTRAEVMALHQSKASSYNHTNGIPYTCIVNPWDESEMQNFPGGGHAPKKIMEAVTAQRKVLNSQHGPSVSRALLTKVTTETARIADALPKDGVAKAMTDYRKLEKSLAKESETLRKKAEAVMEKIVEAATKQLDDAEAAIGTGDLPAAKKILDKLGRSLEGTALDARTKELQAKVKA